MSYTSDDMSRPAIAEALNDVEAKLAQLNETIATLTTSAEDTLDAAKQASTQGVEPDQPDQTGDICQ